MPITKFDNFEPLSAVYGIEPHCYQRVRLELAIAWGTMHFSTPDLIGFCYCYEVNGMQKFLISLSEVNNQ